MTYNLYFMVKSTSNSASMPNGNCLSLVTTTAMGLDITRKCGKGDLLRRITRYYWKVTGTVRLCPKVFHYYRGLKIMRFPRGGGSSPEFRTSKTDTFPA